jgi:ADP-heptose:LPS heptosyltransferase
MGMSGRVNVLVGPETRRVALVRLRVGLGDLLCSLPAWRALRTARPDLHVTVITWAEMGPLVHRMRRYVDELLPFPGYDGIPERPPRREAWQPFLQSAHAHEFDIALQSYGDRPAANEVAGLLSARRVGGFLAAGARPVGGDAALYLNYPRQIHEVQRHLQLMAHLGVPVGVDDDAMEFPYEPGDEARYQALAAETGLRPGTYAVLHPGASAPTRCWPTQRYAELGDAFSRRGLRVVVAGQAGERHLTTEVCDQMHSPPIDLTGRTDVGSYAALLHDAALLVCNDTGAAHLGAAVGTPTVTVFLSGDRVRWAHRLPTHRAASVDVGCNPCGLLKCPIDLRCAAAVSVNHVLALADGLLG